MKCAGKICEKRKRWQPKRGSTLPRIHITPEEVNLQRYAQPTSPPVTVSVMVDDGLESMDEARLLPIIIDKQQCRFGAQVRYDSLQGCHLCCIRVDDPYYKTYTCQRKVSQVVAIFLKSKCYNIADLSVSSFAKTYKLIAIENWQRILTFEVIKTTVENARLILSTQTNLELKFIWPVRHRRKQKNRQKISQTIKMMNLLTNMDPCMRMHW